MHLYLIRHAEAVNVEENPARPLSARGREEARALARFLSARGLFVPDEIWHSPLARARETAALLAPPLNRKAPPSVEVAEIQPESDPQIVADQLRKVRRSIAVVGHEPHLSALGTLLVGAASEAPAIFVMKKCAVLALEGAGPSWQVMWHLSPDLIA